MRVSREARPLFGVCLAAAVLSQTLPVVGFAQGAASYLALGVGEGSLAGSCGGLPEANSVAFYWNPALACYGGRFVYAEYAGVFGSFGASLASLQTVAAGFPVRGEAAVQIGYIGFVVDEIPLYPELGSATFVDRMENSAARPGGEPRGWFSDHEQAAFVCFARPLRVRMKLTWLTEEVAFDVPLGLSFKFLRQSIASWSASGSGLDLGAGLMVDFRQFSDSPLAGTFLVAFRRTDVTGTKLHWSGAGGQKVEPTSSWAATYQMRLTSDASVQILLQHDRGWRSRTTAGLALRFSAARIYLGRAPAGLSFGLGLDLWKFGLTYGRQPFELGNVERFGVRWDW